MGQEMHILSSMADTARMYREDFAEAAANRETRIGACVANIEKRLDEAGYGVATCEPTEWR
ncbi:MAG: hypothetical protein ACRBCT_09985 [Alphaproteobacteria bacterium]